MPSIHSTLQCPIIKNGEGVKKCSNCGGNHSANYRGCPIYKELKIKLKRKQQQARGRVRFNEPNYGVGNFENINQSVPPNNDPVLAPQVQLSLPSPGISYANALLSGSQQPRVPVKNTCSDNIPSNSHEPSVPLNMGGFETMFFTLMQTMNNFMSTMQSTMSAFMSSIQGTIEELKSQNKSLHAILSKK